MEAALDCPSEQVPWRGEYPRQKQNGALSSQQQLAFHGPRWHNLGGPFSTSPPGQIPHLSLTTEPQAAWKVLEGVFWIRHREEMVPHGAEVVNVLTELTPTRSTEATEGRLSPAPIHTVTHALICAEMEASCMHMYTDADIHSILTGTHTCTHRC